MRIAAQLLDFNERLAIVSRGAFLGAAILAPAPSFSNYIRNFSVGSSVGGLLVYPCAAQEHPQVRPARGVQAAIPHSIGGNAAAIASSRKKEGGGGAGGRDGSVGAEEIEGGGGERMSRVWGSSAY